MAELVLDLGGVSAELVDGGVDDDDAGGGEPGQTAERVLVGGRGWGEVVGVEVPGEADVVPPCVGDPEEVAGGGADRATPCGHREAGLPDQAAGPGFGEGAG